jgi:hypothetical protein
VIGRTQHLHDDRLFDCYVAARGSEPADPRAADHLLACDACAARYAELAAFMGSLRAEADADADSVFTPDRLWHQRQQIVERLQHVGRAARVISFPGKLGRHMAATTRVAPRWLAAAAAAGLFVGVAVGGMMFDSGFHVPSATTLMARSKPPRRMPPPPVRVTSPASIVEAPALTAPAPAAVSDDDSFLSELENALQRPRTRELVPYDALTPHVREISNQLR